MKKDVLNDLYIRQAKIIYAYLLKNSCPKEIAEEIVHDSFVKAIQHFETLSLAKLPSWLFKVAVNEYRNYLRKKSIVSEMLIDYTSFTAKFTSEEDFSENIDKQEAARSVRECLASIKTSYKELLILKHEMELSYREIAELLGLPENTIKTYLYRARTAFRDEWRRKYNEQLPG